MYTLEIRTGHSYTLDCTHPLVCLFLGDLLNLVQELPNPQLQLTQLLFGCNLAIVDCMFPNRNFQVNTLGKVEVHNMRGERPQHVRSS